MNNLTNISEAYIKSLDLYIKKIVISFGSATEDNIESMNHIQLGYSDSGFGIKIKNKELFVSDIINALEDMEEPPREVKEYYPDITDREWQASTRLSTLILLLFEKSLKEFFLKKYSDKPVKLNDYNKIRMINNSDMLSNKVRRLNNG